MMFCARHDVLVLPKGFGGGCTDEESNLDEGLFPMFFLAAGHYYIVNDVFRRLGDPSEPRDFVPDAIYHLHTAGHRSSFWFHYSTPPTSNSIRKEKNTRFDMPFDWKHLLEDSTGVRWTGLLIYKQREFHNP
jgi:hypothetical protein